MKVLLLNGPNLNLLGIRQPELYGTTTLRDIVEDLRHRADARGASLRDMQSNHEGALIDFLQEHADADGECCQPEGKQIADLPPEGQRKARERMAQAKR